MPFGVRPRDSFVGRRPDRYRFSFPWQGIQARTQGDHSLPSLRDTTNVSATTIPAKTKDGKESKGNGYYVLQFEAVGDFDAAERRRAQIAASTGYNIQVVFEAPFYKLRGGGWTSKKAADDKARELSAYNINALVVKLR